MSIIRLWRRYSSSSATSWPKDTVRRDMEVDEVAPPPPPEIRIFYLLGPLEHQHPPPPPPRFRRAH